MFYSFLFQEREVVGYFRLWPRFSFVIYFEPLFVCFRLLCRGGNRLQADHRELKHCEIDTGARVETQIFAHFFTGHFCRAPLGASIYERRPIFLMIIWSLLRNWTSIFVFLDRQEIRDIFSETRVMMRHHNCIIAETNFLTLLWNRELIRILYSLIRERSSNWGVKAGENFRTT